MKRERIGREEKRRLLVDLDNKKERRKKRDKKTCNVYVCAFLL